MRHNGGRRPDEILAEIDRTRGEMDRTLSAIEHRLTPGQLVDQGLDYLRQSGATEFVGNLGGAAKNNPLPVALTGIGIAWLMALGRQPAQHQGSGAAWFEPSSSTGAALREKASGMAQGVSERMSSVKDTTREQWQRARGGVDYLVNEQPLVLGAIGLALGALLGGVAPRTQKEQELMGEASRNFVDKAKEAGSQQVKKATESVKQAAASPSTAQPKAPRLGTP